MKIQCIYEVKKTMEVTFGDFKTHQTCFSNLCISIFLHRHKFGKNNSRTAS